MKKTEAEKSIGGRTSVDSYADRVHRYISHLCGGPGYRGPDGKPIFREWINKEIPAWIDRYINTGAILRLIDSSPELPDKYKRAQVKAIARIGILYGLNNNSINVGLSVINLVNDYIAKVKNNQGQKKPRFIRLYTAVKNRLEQTGILPSHNELERLCEEHLLEREKGDPTRKFREASRKRATDDEYRQECWAAEREDRWDP